MGPRGRWMRGVLLRAAYNRVAAVTVGLLLTAVSGALVLGDYSWESWLTDGAALVLGATGAALVVTGLSGRRGDWVEPRP